MKTLPHTYSMCYLVRVVRDAPLLLAQFHVLSLRITRDQHAVTTLSLKSPQIVKLVVE